MEDNINENNVIYISKKYPQNIDIPRPKYEMCLQQRHSCSHFFVSLFGENTFISNALFFLTNLHRPFYKF